MSKFRFLQFLEVQTFIKKACISAQQLSGFLYNIYKSQRVVEQTFCHNDYWNRKWNLSRIQIAANVASIYFVLFHESSLCYQNTSEIIGHTGIFSLDRDGRGAKSFRRIILNSDLWISQWVIRITSKNYYSDAKFTDIKEKEVVESHDHLCCEVMWHFSYIDSLLIL